MIQWLLSILVDLRLRANERRAWANHRQVFGRERIYVDYRSIR